jgi:hypothetical protein
MSLAAWIWLPGKDISSLRVGHFPMNLNTPLVAPKSGEAKVCCTGALRLDMRALAIPNSRGHGGHPFLAVFGVVSDSSQSRLQLRCPRSYSPT